MKSLGGGCQLPLGTYVRKDKDEYLIDACIAYPSGEGLMKVQKRSSENELIKNARSIASEFLSNGAAEMIAHLTEAQRREKAQ